MRDDEYEEATGLLQVKHTSSSAQHAGIGNPGVRHGMLLLFTSCGTLCYADRTNLSVALVAMRREFGWDGSTSGSLLSAFFIGYLFTQIPGGYFACLLYTSPSPRD